MLSTTPSPRLDSQTGQFAARTRRMVSWSTPTLDLWVLNHHHTFGGTIDRHGARFIVIGSRGEPLGHRRTLTAAQQLLLDRTPTPSMIGTAA